MPTRMLALKEMDGWVPHRLEKGTNVSEDAGR